MALRRLRRLACSWWRAAQVEFRGHYSNAQLKRFEEYQATTSLWRVAAVCLFMPLPTLAVLILLGLLPLEPAEKGALGSPNLWLRQWLVMLLMSLCTLQQLRQHLPEFQINRIDCIAITLSASTLDVAFVVALASLVGYPLPFTVILGGLPWYLTFIVIFSVRKRGLLQTTPGSFATMRRYIIVSLCQLAMTIVYPVYSYIYKGLSPMNQTGFVLLLPVFKLINKNWIGRALPDSDDAKPEAIVFNVEVFHSLFVSLCMGNTASGRTVAVLMAIDLAEAWLSFHDVLSVLRKLEPVTGKMRQSVDTRLHLLSSFPMIANEIVQADASSRDDLQSSAGAGRGGCSFRPSCLHFQLVNARSLAKLLRRPNQVNPGPPNALFSLQGASISRPEKAAARVAPVDYVSPFNSPAPRGSVVASVRMCLTAEESKVLVTQTQKLLFVIEVIVLIEYTEVIMPTIYNVLVVAFYYLPNRDYYAFFDTICSYSALRSIVSNVQIYSCLELASLVVMALVLWRKIGVSVVHQLAFVLEDHTANIQSKLLMWVLYIVQNSITQLGSDYSFRFEWLDRQPGATLYVSGTSCQNATG